MDKMAGVIAVGEMLERMFGIRVRSGKPAYEQYTDLTETLVQKLSKDATNRTMYYAGRCAGDALVMATGAMEIAEGLNSFFSGIGGTVVADASGVACVASGVTLTITAEGVVTIVDGGYTIYNSAVAIQGDSRQYRDARGADHKASESGSVTKPNQVHHYATNKSKTYTPQLEEIANRYELDLDDAWNKDLLPHQGRHPNAYHEYVLDSMKQFDNIAQGDKDIFLKLFDNLKNNVKSNPDMLYKDYWK